MPINKKILFTILWSINLLLYSSCKKEWLDQKPDKTITVPTTLDDFDALLNNTSSNGSALTIGEVAADGHYILESSWQASIIDAQRNAHTWSHDRLYNNVLDWNLSYQSILIANIILEGLIKIVPENDKQQQQWNRVKGEALFLRARLFHDLAQMYAVPFDKTSAESDLGIPLRLESDITIPSSRGTLKETYNKIIEDLSEANNLLPLVSSFATHASKPAALAMLARVYLSMEDYEKAFESANACLQSYNALLDFNTLSTSSNFIGGYNRNNREVIYHSTGVNYNIVTSRSLVDTSLYSLYQDNDLRKTIYFKKTGNNITFKGNYNNSTSLLFFGLATDEMFLIRAECYARLGKVPESMNDLNTLLKTRWITGTFIDFTAADADDALNQILLERKKELIYRGQRWPDLRRLNKDSRFAIDLTRTIGGNTYMIEPKSYKYTFPIPDDVIQLSKMQQNPGWK